MKERRKEGRKEGRKGGRKEGRKGGRKEVYNLTNRKADITSQITLKMV
jgi:flagellar biosynthesis/type III secretory pathway protein FliH